MAVRSCPGEFIMRGAFRRATARHQGKSHGRDSTVPRRRQEASVLQHRRRRLARAPRRPLHRARRLLQPGRRRRRAAAARRVRPHRPLDRPRRAAVADGRAPGRAGQGRRASLRRVGRACAPARRGRKSRRPGPTTRSRSAASSTPGASRAAFKVQPFSSDPQALLLGLALVPAPADGACPLAPTARAQPPAAPLRWNRRARDQRGDFIVARRPTSPTAMPPRRCAARASSSRAPASRRPAADEFYWVDLIGLAVVNREGVALGTVVGLLDTGPHSVLRVAAERTAEGGEERLIPFVAAYVDTVDLAGAPHHGRLGPRLLSRARCASTSSRCFRSCSRPSSTHGVTRRAFDAGRVDVRLWPLRDFADGPHRRVDDRPYGGGPGMVMLAEPLERALPAIRAERAEATPAPVVQLHARPASASTRRGVERLRRRRRARCCCAAATKASTSASSTATSTWSSASATSCCPAARLPALALLDAVARLQPGVLGDPGSHQQDSFSDGLLDCPHYSRPERLGGDGARGARVLLSGPPRRDRALAPRAVARD